MTKKTNTTTSTPKHTVDRYERVKLTDLIQRDMSKNPRRGALDIIKESLQERGQYSPLTVNESTMEVLVGNHRLIAMREMGWDECDIAIVNVSEQEANAIVLVDNRSADLGAYNPDVLGDILANVESVLGTGYSEQDLALILSANEEDPMTTSLLMEALSPDPIVWDHEEEEIEDLDVLPEDHGAEDEELPVSASKPKVKPPKPSKNPGKLIESLDQISDELEGILDLKSTIKFPVQNAWGIPQVRPDYVVEKLPSPLDTWAGNEVTPDDGQSWWLYNYGVDSAAGLPFERSILSFYTYDHYFENWWRYPAKYTAKMLNAGIRVVVSPNYSLYVDDPPAVQLWNVFRARWLGRYFQEGGLKLIPDVDGPTIESLDWTLLGVPVGTPVIAHQFQTLNRDDIEQHEKAADVLEEIIARLDPKQVLLYTGPTGARIIESRTWKPEIVMLGNRASKRRGVVFG